MFKFFSANNFHDVIKKLVQDVIIIINIVNMEYQKIDCLISKLFLLKNSIIIRIESIPERYNTLSRLNISKKYQLPNKTVMLIKNNVFIKWCFSLKKIERIEYRIRDKYIINKGKNTSK